MTMDAMPFVRGTTLYLLTRIPDNFDDGFFSAWTPQSQLRTYAGALIADIDAQWVDVQTARHLRLKCAATSAWPTGLALFDICLTAPDGERIYTTAQRIHITTAVTRP